ncbi:MAG: adenylate/guanylate cyclase domain-containing protein, partial [bacterium]
MRCRDPTPPEKIREFDGYLELQLCQEGEEQWQIAREFEEFGSDAPAPPPSGPSGKPDSSESSSSGDESHSTPTTEKVEEKQTSTTETGSESAVQTRSTKRNVTVLFADVSGFTELTEKLGAETTQEWMNDLFSRLEKDAQRYDGEIDKYVGDEMMVLFGASRAHADDPERAVRCGLDMLDTVSAFSDEKDQEVALHIGINTGDVVAGELGGEEVSDFSVMGNGVNIAARLTSETDQNELLIGKDTQRRLRGRFELKPVGELNLKGVSEPVTGFRVKGEKEDVSAMGSDSGDDVEFYLPFVGREEEFKQLSNSVEGLRKHSDESPRVELVLGEMGVGKSRLLSHFVSNQVPEEEIDVITIRGNEYADRLAYSACLEFIDF